ncbi:heat-shock protein Hsp20 [Candidatus Endobugula sertula]|uniref:Heat-shock protein Hsp20 n=1 Tax=Candidatus Endobugula sertula TaxID=62101 RepID=A0A1D2QTP1_9GAMM|nr:heat-shock protein Hsp20 [Candidatus Endobugula sertula]
MNLVRYEPTTMLNRMYDDLNQFFKSNDWMPDVFDERRQISTSQWLPSVDIQETDDQFKITADIPGVEPKDINVSMENGMLSIKGERKTEKKDEENGYRRVERSYGSFHRRFGLPETADSDQISAQGKNGVLEITVQKREVSKARKIEVKS